MNHPPVYDELLERLQPFGQSHVLRFWEQLKPDQQQVLASQLGSIDFALIESLASSHTAGENWHRLAARAEPPPAVTLDQFHHPGQYQQAYDCGAEAIAAGKVAMILTAGGQGSRLGFEHPKGMFPIGPVSGRTLYQVILEKALARARQFQATIPMYIMSSPATERESEAFLEQHHFFGYDRGSIHQFSQGTMPATDRDGKLLMAEKGSLFLSPDGHGGMLAGLAASGCLQDIRDRGIQHVFYGQIDNPLIQACDPALIGYHIQSGSEMTTQVVRKSDPLQKVGNVVSIDGQVRIIEYSDLPEEFARQTNPNGSLKLWAGSIAVHVFETEFLYRTSVQSDALPFHLAHKQVPCLDERGVLIHPQQPNASKFEKFIFDLLPWAANAIVCEVDPAEGFCAVKNAPPAASETAEHVQAAMVAQHARWLRSVGVEVGPNVPVEINPLFAVEPSQLVGRFSPPLQIEEPRYFV